MSDSLRIATCNLQSGIGTTRGYWHYLVTGWKYLLPHDSGLLRLAATFLEEARIDLVAFCEIEGGSWRSRGFDQVRWLAESTPLTHTAYFPTFTRKGPFRRVWHTNQGNALCGRNPLSGAQQHLLPGRGEPRFLCEARVRFGETPVQVYLTHLSLNRSVRARQVRRVAEVVVQSEGPTILTGDFNASSDEELRPLIDGPLTPTRAGVTYPSWAPSRTLDHLFFSRHFEISGSYVFDRFLFSDHLPIVAEVRLC